MEGITMKNYKIKMKKKNVAKKYLTFHPFSALKTAKQ